MNSPIASISTTFVLLFAGRTAYAQDQSPCPVPPTQVSIKLIPDVSYDKTTKIYSYTYRLTNTPGSALAVDSFYIFTNLEPISISDLELWVAEYESDLPNIPNRIAWTTSSGAIPIGRSSKIFSFKSKFPPGPVRYATSGESDILSSVPDDSSDEPTPNCPGFFFGAPWPDRHVTGVTVGPVSSDVVAANLKVGRIDEKTHRQCMHVSHKDKSRVKVTVYGSDTLNVADIDISSLKFGPGEAKPLNTKIIPFEDDDEHEKPRDGKKAIKQPKMLRMEFSIVDLKLRCNLDHALFLTGKVGAKNLFGGVEVAPDACTTLDVRKPPRKLKKEKI